MWRRFCGTFLAATAIGVAIGLLLGGIAFATAPPLDRWRAFFAVFSVSGIPLMVIGILSGFAMMSKRDTSAFRTLSKIAAAGILGVAVGNMIEPFGKPNLVTVLLAMVAAAVVIRLIGDKWFTLGQLPQKPPESNER